MISKKWSLCLAAIGFVVTTGLALPETKKDFERAARETEGCVLIPYETLRDSCHSAYGRQREWCTRERALGCKDLSKDQKDEARKRRDNAAECLPRRQEVRQKYTESIDKLKGEREDDIRPLAEEIIRRTEATFPDHDQVIKDTILRRDRCNDLLQ